MKRQNRKVLVNGKPQIWTGVNFWSRTGGPLMWRNYQPGVIRALGRGLPRDAALYIMPSVKQLTGPT